MLESCRATVLGEGEIAPATGQFVRAGEPR